MVSEWRKNSSTSRMYPDHANLSGGKSHLLQCTLALVIPSDKEREVPQFNVHFFFVFLGLVQNKSHPYSPPPEHLAQFKGMALQRGQGHHVLIVQPPQGSPWHSMFIFSVRHQPYAEKLEQVLLKAVSDCQIKRGIQARTETFNGLTTSGGILVLNKNCKKITAEI